MRDLLYQQWLAAKDFERAATEERRNIEDQLIQSLNLPESGEGSQTINDGAYKVRVTYRMNRTINGDELQEIAAENGLTEHLGSLFRWKPEINAKAWKAADESITAPLADAITTKPGRPSFSIEKEEDNENG